MVELVHLDESRRPAFEELLSEVWEQTWTDQLAKEIVQWRYYDRPEEAVTWLAMDNDHCVGMLDTMLRPYLLDGQRIVVRETADWYCMPSHRSSALGLHLMWCLRRHPESVFVVGGSPATRNMLAKMRWDRLPASADYVLPIKARGLAAMMLRRSWWSHETLARLVPNFLPAKRPKRIKPPTGQRATVRILDRHDDITLPPCNRSGLIQLLEPAHWRWLCRMPAELARPIGLEFFVNDVLMGFSLVQIEPAATGMDGKILLFQVADPTLAAWVLSETTQMLADHHVGFIRGCVSTPDKVEAMESVGYIKVQDLPCYWLSRATPAPQALDIGFLRGDDAIPYRVLRGRKLASAASSMQRSAVDRDGG